MFFMSISGTKPATTSRLPRKVSWSPSVKTRMPLSNTDPTPTPLLMVRSSLWNTLLMNSASESRVTTSPLLLPSPLKSRKVLTLSTLESKLMRWAITKLITCGVTTLCGCTYSRLIYCQKFLVFKCTRVSNTLTYKLIYVHCIYDTFRDLNIDLFNLTECRI